MDLLGFCFGFVGIRQNLLAFVGTCWDFSGLVEIFWDLSGFVGNPQVSTSWDKSVKVWEIQKSAPQPSVRCNAVKGPEHNHDLPVLCASISKDCRIFTGGCDKMVKCWELASGKPPYQVAAHDQPVKGVAWLDEVWSFLEPCFPTAIPPAEKIQSHFQFRKIIPRSFFQLIQAFVSVVFMHRFR